MDLSFTNEVALLTGAGAGIGLTTARASAEAGALAQALKSKAGQAVYAENPDLSAIRGAGGKLIQYHSWNAPAIPGGASVK